MTDKYTIDDVREISNYGPKVMLIGLDKAAELMNQAYEECCESQKHIIDYLKKEIEDHINYGNELQEAINKIYEISYNEARHGENER